MNAAEFLIQLLDKLAWPIGAIVLCILLRKPICSLIRELDSLKLKYKDWALVLERKLEARKESLPQEDLKREENERIEYYRELASISPRDTILKAWFELEAFMEETLQKAGDRSFKFCEQLTSNSMVKLGMTRPQIETLNDLRGIKNEVLKNEQIASTLLAERFAILMIALKIGISKINEEST